MILLVDDSQAQHSLQVGILTEHGIPESDILRAANGEEALSLARANPVNLVVTDWNMPVMNGLELVRAMRRESMQAPIVMVTSESEQSRFIEALEAGANGYVTKPITRRALLDAIEAYLG